MMIQQQLNNSKRSESNSLSPPFFTGTNGTAQKGRPRKRKLMINHHQNDPLRLGTAMQMGMYFISLKYRSHYV